MDTKDIADLFITATGKIEFYWNFYSVTVLALIGWLVSTKIALSLKSFEEQKDRVIPTHLFVGTFIFVAIWLPCFGERFTGNKKRSK